MKMNSSTVKSMDPLDGKLDNYKWSVLMRDGVRKLRRSPDIFKMYSIEIPQLRAVFYQETLKQQKKSAVNLKNTYPGYTIIIKNK